MTLLEQSRALFKALNPNHGTVTCSCYKCKQFMHLPVACDHCENLNDPEYRANFKESKRLHGLAWVKKRYTRDQLIDRVSRGELSAEVLQPLPRPKVSAHPSPIDLDKFGLRAVRYKPQPLKRAQSPLPFAIAALPIGQARRDALYALGDNLALFRKAISELPIGRDIRNRVIALIDAATSA